MKKSYIKILLILLISIVLNFGNIALAANNNATQSKEPEILTDAEKSIISVDFVAANEKIKQIQEELSQDTISAESIDEYVSYLSSIDAQLIEDRKDLSKQIKFIQKQLDVFGEAPKEGESEDEEVTMQRSQLMLKMSAYDKIIKEIDLLLVQIEDLTGKILNVRNQKIYGDLMTKQSAMINPLVFFRGIKAYVIFFWDVTKSPIVWYKNLPQGQRSYALLSIITMFMILMVALIAAIFLRKFILKNWGYTDDIKMPHFNRKVIAAIAVAIARGLIFAFLVSGCILWMISTKIFGDTLLNTVLMTAAFTCLLAIVEATISRVTFAPHYPNWRLVNIRTEKAVRFTRMIFWFIIINSIAAFQVIVAQKEEYSTDTVHFVMMMSVAVKAFFLMWFAKITFDTYKDEKKSENYETMNEEDEVSVDRGFKMILFSYLCCFIIFALSLVGYPELSLFIFNHIILTLIIIGVFEVIRRSFIDITKRLIVAGPWMKKYRSSKKFIGKMEFWLKVLINPIFILILIFTLLNIWGLPGDFMLQASRKLLFGFKIGGIEISIIAIALGIAVFFGSLAVMRFVRVHLATNVLARIDMDDGVRHSLISGFSFLGFIISILLAVIAVGIDLTNLAFIAGALSVGIGFGLQDVIKNLVAGIIILLERPFKVGDWVMLNGTEGTIKQINIRSTELLAFNKTSVIIPNATLISSSVTNMTHGDAMSRQSVAVGVSYGSNPEQVKEILLECAKKNRKIMTSPAPYVLFKDFGSSSLDFELRFYVNDIWKGWSVPSELRYEIFSRFQEENIEIPFPQIVINKPNSDIKEDLSQEKDGVNEN
ncbi:MAG: mechanosensitive ion channel family protein [Alphaproteobacteria bacterium]|nr:mechanosensitive ion channel family protein [Alphaproteobacteria bacterium]